MHPPAAMADITSMESFEVAVPLSKARDSAPEESSPPPKAWVMIADWCNLLAGVTLFLAFFIGALIYDAAYLTEADYGSLMSAFFAIEGALYAVAGFFMVGIMAQTPPTLGGGARGTMQFAVLMTGGIFFAFSSLVVPPCIANVTVIFSSALCPLNGHPFAWNAMAHYGITCFMGGTLVGFKGVLPLYPIMKNQLLSPFWGVTMYFMGAWTIGIFKIWGPTIAGGFGSVESVNDVLVQPPITATWGWWMASLGAAFLTTGAAILLKLDLKTTLKNDIP